MSRFAFLWIIPGLLFAEQGLRFERYLNTKQQKICEHIKLNSNFMRVDGPSYTYVFDMKEGVLWYRSENSHLYIIPFENLFEQAKQMKKSLGFQSRDFKIQKEGNIIQYKGAQAIKTRIVPKNKDFITVYFLNKNLQAEILLTFLNNLFEQIRFFPLVLNQYGIDKNSPFNEMIQEIFMAFAFYNEGIEYFPIMILRSSSITQMEITNIVFQNLIHDDFFSGISQENHQSESVFDKFFSYMGSVWKRSRKFFN